MRIAKGHIVPLGYGKYFRADSIVGFEPLEEGRGPGKRTRVYIEDLPAPLLVSRSEGAILRDLVEMPTRRAHQRHTARQEVEEEQRDSLTYPMAKAHSLTATSPMAMS